MAHILPHWNWPERVGQVTPVHVYTSGDEAELFLNGKSLGRKKKSPVRTSACVWDDVKYEPGNSRPSPTRTARNGRPTPSKPPAPPPNSRWQPTARRSRPTAAICPSSPCASPTTTASPCRARHNLVKFAIAGPGEIVAVDNGDPTSFEPFQAARRKAFNGLALVIVRAKPGECGNIKLTATSDGLKSAEIQIEGK